MAWCGATPLKASHITLAVILFELVVNTYMSSIFTPKQKAILFSIFFLIASIITLLIFIDNHYRYQKIFNEKVICYAKVIDEQRDYIGGKPQTFKYKLKYYYNGVTYTEYAPHMYEYGHFKKDQNIQIILQKSNPYNFIVSDKSNYWGHLCVSILFFTIFFFCFKYREILSKRIL